MSFYNQILPNLYLGSIEASTDEKFIKDNNINVIVNCSKDIKNSFDLNLLKPIEEAPLEVQKWLYENSYYIKYYRLSIDDNGKDIEINNFFELGVPLLSKVITEIKNGKNILVHCLAGNQRSAAFTVALIMCLHKKNLEEAISFVSEKKPNIFFFGRQNNFIKPLERINNVLFG